MSMERKENAIRNKPLKNTMTDISITKFLKRQRRALKETEEIRQKTRSKSSSNAYDSKYMSHEPTLWNTKASLVNKLATTHQTNPDILTSAASPKISLKIHKSRTTERRRYLMKKPHSGINNNLQISDISSYEIPMANLHREKSVPRRNSLFQLGLSERETDANEQDLEVEDDRTSRVSCCPPRSSTSGTSKSSDIFVDLDMQDYVGLVPAPLATSEDTSDVQKNVNCEEDQELQTPFAVTDRVSVMSKSLISLKEKGMLWYRALRPMAARVMAMLACMFVPMLWMGVGIGLIHVAKVIARPDSYDSIPRRPTLEELQIVEDMKTVINYAYRAVGYLIGEFR